MRGLLLLATSFLAPVAPSPGPAVGETVPAFEARDHEGRPRTLESLRGPEGLVLVFFRSADW